MCVNWFYVCIFKPAAIAVYVANEDFLDSFQQLTQWQAFVQHLLAHRLPHQKMF